MEHLPRPRKGHDYVTCFSDMDTGELLSVVEGRGVETVTEFVKSGSKQGLEPEKITAVSVDMSPAFGTGLKERLPNAIIEDFNSKIQAMKRSVRGCRDTQTLLLMIRWHCAKQRAITSAPPKSPHRPPFPVADGALIVQEAGGTITDFSGGGNWLHDQEMIAANGKISEAFLETVRAHFG